MADTESLGFGVDDIEIIISRMGMRWSCKIAGCLLPKEMHHAQKLLQDYYKTHRRKIAQAYNQSKSRERKKEADRIEKQRDAKAKNNEDMTDSPSQIQPMAQVLENQGANDGRAE